MPLDLSPPLVERRIVPTKSVAAYRADIDGLRALAILPVLLFHSGAPGFSGGYVGVDVFFVISGYLITGHIADEIAGGHMSLARFYARRFRRILPALFATLILTWLVSAFLLLPSYLLALSKALLAAAASVSNIYLWQTAGYFAPDSAFQPLLHTWSLSVEEQFYLVVPILMMLTAKPLRGRWVLLFGPLCLLSFALSVYATARAPTANFYLLPTRAWELGLGALTATAPLPRIGRRWVAETVSAAALLLMLAPVFVFDDATPFPGVNASYPCLGAALLIHTGRSDRSGAKTLLSARPLVAIGLISYSLYLVHWPLISLLRAMEVAPPAAPQIILLLMASFGLATLSWRFIEQPFRRQHPALTQRRVLLGGVAAMGVASLVGLIGIGGRGFPSRLPDFAEQVIPGHADWKPGRCFLLGNPDHRAWSLEDCTRIATGPTKVLLWGDSFGRAVCAGHPVRCRGAGGDGHPIYCGRLPARAVVPVLCANRMRRVQRPCPGPRARAEDRHRHHRRALDDDAAARAGRDPRDHRCAGAARGQGDPAGSVAGVRGRHPGHRLPEGQQGARCGQPVGRGLRSHRQPAAASGLQDGRPLPRPCRSCATACAARIRTTGRICSKTTDTSRPKAAAGSCTRCSRRPGCSIRGRLGAGRPPASIGWVDRPGVVSSCRRHHGAARCRTPPPCPRCAQSVCRPAH